MGRKPLDPSGIKTERVSLVLGQDELSAIDEWRRLNARLPSRSQAIRQLTHRGLLITEAIEYASQASLRPSIGRGRKVLIIDDDQCTALAIKIAMNSIGFEVVGVVASAEEALTLAMNNRPEIIISETVIGRDAIGIGIVNSILEKLQAVAVFVTSYPENFLAGLRPEPSYMMMKPLRIPLLSDIMKKAVEIKDVSISGNLT